MHLTIKALRPCACIPSDLLELCFQQVTGQRDYWDTVNLVDEGRYATEPIFSGYGDMSDPLAPLRVGLGGAGIRTQLPRSILVQLGLFGCCA